MTIARWTKCSVATSVGTPAPDSIHRSAIDRPLTTNETPHKTYLTGVSTKSGQHPSLALAAELGIVMRPSSPSSRSRSSRCYASPWPVSLLGLEPAMSLQRIFRLRRGDRPSHPISLALAAELDLSLIHI